MNPKNSAVIPAKAGIQRARSALRIESWIPANAVRWLAGMTLIWSLAACGGSQPEAPHADHQGEHAEVESAKGAHGGRLLRDGAFALELSIFEQGVPPEYRAWATLDGKPLPPAAVKLDVQLVRFGGVQQAMAFKPSGDFLRGTSEVYEPHSFTVEVRAEHGGTSHVWNYESFEGRTTIAADMAAQAGIVTATAGAGVMAETLKLYGTVEPDASRVRAVKARFPGVVRRMARSVGEAVRQGETLATVESNDSLQTYAVTAPISGVVTARQGAVGEVADAEPLYTLADFSTVWVALQAFPRDRARLRLGQPLTVFAEGGREVQGKLDFISAQGQSGEPTLMVRAVLDNRDGRWTPGEFVTAEIAVREANLPLVVPLAAVQTFRDWDVVFANDGESYQALPVTLGQRDARHVEVREGLSPGMRIVTANSYLVKADIEKSGASHDH